MPFNVISALFKIETIARGKAIRELKRLNRVHGKAYWRKKKAIAIIQFEDGSSFSAELHWYEANSVGKREIKIKKLISKL